MFRKLYQPPPIPPQRKITTYSQQNLHRSKLKQTSYSRMHKAKRTVVSSTQDFHIVCNESYIYQGEWHNQYRNGEGIAYLKNGTFIIGNWTKDQLNGRALIFTPFGAMLSANFVAGKLNGWVLAMYRDKVVIANLYFEDKIDGPRLIYEGSQQLWLCSTITNTNQLIKMSRVSPGKRTQLPSYVEDDQLSQLFRQLIINKNYIYGFKKIKQLKITEDTIYIGYLGMCVPADRSTSFNQDRFKQNELPNGLGITYSVEECFVGNFRDGYLEIMGRIVFGNGDIYHGGVHLGQFANNGIYYNPTKNTTLILHTPPSSPNQPQILQQQTGYYLIDFQQTLGQRISKQDNIVLTLGSQNFIKLLQKYYHQYFIQARKKNQAQAFSNVSQKASENGNMEDIDGDEEQKEEKNIINVKPARWVTNQEGSNEEQAISQQGQLDQNQKIRIKYQSKNNFYSPKHINLSSSFNDQFNSLQIKQNHEEWHNENYNRNYPKIAQTKRDMFHNSNISNKNTNNKQISASQSLDVNQLTFRGSNKSKSNQNSARTGRNYAENYYDGNNYQQDQRNNTKMAYSHQESDRESSNISHLEDKITGIMRKSTIRKKIFS